MNAVQQETIIDRSPAEVLAYVGDIAMWPEWTDHFLTRWHLTNEDSYGRGAGARFHVDRRLDRFGYADLTFHEFETRGFIRARGRMGKFNRTRWIVELELDEASGGTRVRLSVATAPGLPTDRLMEAVTFTKAFHRRRWGKALRRLRSILEDGEERGSSATIAGGARKPATRTPIRAA
jgi:polyketide cyclase/dehydrase/lipid transport protein